VEIHRNDPDVEARQIQRVKTVRDRRDNARVAVLLDALAEQAKDPSKNLMPLTIELVEARATMGEIVRRLRDVFGSYAENPAF
jgi:methylmalonyl-CoA mutase N-terminal domain/subunit